MSSSKELGDRGEELVVSLVRCPNCGKRLLPLPPGYPLYDVQCEGCLFRAQVKASSRPPGRAIRGAGWDIIVKARRLGHVLPPLIVVSTWPTARGRSIEIRFYPFVPMTALRKHTLSARARRANYRMFDYVGLADLPHFILLSRVARDK